MGDATERPTAASVCTVTWDGLKKRNSLASSIMLLLWLYCMAGLLQITLSCPSTCLCPTSHEVICNGVTTTGQHILAPVLSVLHGDSVIEILEVTDANVNVLRDGWFSALPRLRRLVLDDDRITAIEDGVFSDVPSLHELSLCGNLLQQLSPSFVNSTAALDRLFLSRNPLVLPTHGSLLYSSLRWLQLDACGLTHLPDDVFLGLRNLRVLQLRDNSLETLGHALLPLTRLSVLALQGNRLVRQVFALPQSLNMINIDGNDLNAIDKGMFDSAKDLEYLFVGNNIVSQLQSGSLLTLTRLKFLDITGNKLNNSFSGLSTNVSIEFAHLQQLTSLKIDGNEIETLSLEVFKRLEHLRDLSLSRNKIKTISNEIPDSNFLAGEKEAVVLDTLTLSHNKIDFLGTSLRPFMDSLTHLNLSANRLSSFSSSRLTKQSRSSLKIMDLSFNRINPIYGKTLDLDYLPNLEYLSLRNNYIEDINEDVFRRLKRLKYLDMSFNRFVKLHKYLFRSLKELGELQMKFLNMDNGIQAWPETIFEKLSNLITLSLEGNNINFIPESLFKPLQRLENLDLSYNNFDALNLDTFSDCVNLRVLNLKHNRLHYFSCTFRATCSFSTVIKLDVKGNNFRYFERNISSIFPSLEVLDLSKNILQHLELDSILSFENLTLLKASFNPIKCDCSVQRAWQLYGAKEAVTRVEATCETVDEHAVRPWSYTAALSCEDAISTALIASLVLLGILVAANVVLGGALLCGCGRRRHIAIAEDDSNCWNSNSCRNDSDADSDNVRNTRVEQWRGLALYYGTDSEDEDDPARAGIQYHYDALRWAAARRANSRSTVNVSTTAV